MVQPGILVKQSLDAKSVDDKIEIEEESKQQDKIELENNQDNQDNQDQ